jgi:hypothetical protein
MENRSENWRYYIGDKITSQAYEKYLIISYEIDFTAIDGMEIDYPTFSLKGFYKSDEDGSLNLIEN